MTRATAFAGLACNRASATFKRRGCMGRLLSISLAVLAAARSALAQAPNPTGEATGSEIIVSSRPLTIPIVVCLALFGAAMFAVCRSSRRN